MYQTITFYQENNAAISDFRLKSRTLWNDHISYTRNAIISILGNLGDSTDVASRLFKNQEDIGAFISPYYSTEEVSKLVALLTQHVVLAIDVINDLEGATDKWRLNGVQITDQMSSMNKAFWPSSITQPLWNRHLLYTNEQIVARKDQNWVRDILGYDVNHTTINEFSDLFANGIIYQNIAEFSYKDMR
jgi:hypothetical protein